MARLTVMLVPLAFALIAAETAFYVPKSFYVIDQSGAMSAPVMLLGEKSIFRARRSASSASASSSSSSSSSAGGFGQAFSTSSSNANSNAGGGYGYNPHNSPPPSYQPGYNGPPPNIQHAAPPHHSGPPSYDQGYNGPPQNTHHAAPPQHVESQLYNRFADDGSVSGVGLVGTSTGGNGVFSGSSSTVDSNGKVHFTTHTGKF